MPNTLNSYKNDELCGMNIECVCSIRGFIDACRHIYSL